MAGLNQLCPVCGNGAEVSGWAPNAARVICPRCGQFALTDSLINDLPELFKKSPLRAALMSHTIRRMQRGDQLVTILPSTAETFWSRGHLPSAKEQADDLILWIGDNQTDNASSITTSEPFLDAWIGGIPGRGHAQGLRWLVAEMESNRGAPKLFVHNFAGGRAVLQLTLAGWERYSTLKQVRNESRTAFMAMKFGDAELDDVVDKCFRPAVQKTGFELRVLTDNQRAGLIDDQMRAALLAARFVVADLTHGSFGAYWEAGFADGRGLPVIYTCKRAEWQKAKTHFDTNHMATVLWDTNDLKASEDEMAAIIRATLRAEASPADG
jgi:hypothetical protein